jgi:hypothetical protein
MRKLALLTALMVVPACAHRSPFATVEQLELDTVVLYRNGVGYFERRGQVDDDVLTLKVRKDQVNDLLKSLTVVDADGQAVSVSMPLDPQSWANAALSTLAPGRGSLAEVLDALRGTHVTVLTTGRRISGRIVMVERIINEPDSGDFYESRTPYPVPQGDTRDWKVTLLRGDDLEVVRLSKVRSVTLRDGDLAMQLHRSLDASAGEGMFEQVAIDVRLSEARDHDLMVSYVVAAPMWKPTYRVVLPKKGKGKALLQAWAVVDNTSGEDWSDVSMSLTSGAPIAFQYDLHTPRDVYRTDLTESGVHKRARVAFGETSYGEEEPEPVEEEAAEMDEMADSDDYGGRLADKERDYRKDEAKKSGKRRKAKNAPAPAPKTATESLPGDAIRGGYGGEGLGSSARAESGPSLDYESLRRSTMANARSKQVSGLTRIDLSERVTVPDGTSTMVALVNEEVEAEETFLFKPGGAGQGYESNPYRVVRFKNTSPYVLEPGPISIYSGGSFVGEGLSEAVGTNTSVTIPFAVEPNVLVTSQSRYSGEEMRIVRVLRGVIEVESFHQTTTVWDVRGQPNDEGYTVLVRHTRQGSNYELSQRPEGTEDLEGAYLVPVRVPSKKREGSVTLVEQTPSKTTLAIWDSRVPALFDQLLKASNLDAGARKRLQPIVDRRREIGRIDTEIDGLKRQQAELDQRARETRANLEALKKDPAAGALRKKLSKRLDEFTRDGDKMGRRIVELNSKRLEKKIELEDMLQDFDFRAPAREKKKKATSTAPKKKSRDAREGG